MVRAKEETETAPEVCIKKRRLKRMNYMELGEQEIDEYSWCDGCDTRFRKFCPLHEPLLMVSGDKMGEMESGCHPHVALQPSGILGAGRGALAAEPLPSGLRYKPYHGQVSNRPDPNNQYLLQMRKPNGGRKYVDGEKLSNTDWLQFVNSRNRRKQHLQAFQHEGQIFYRTVKNINACMDLLVWYGPAYAKQLNIDPKQYHTPLCAHRLTRILLQGSLQHKEEQAAGEASSALEPHPFTSTMMPSVTLKDVEQDKVVREIAAFLKKSGKLPVPEFVDLVKTGRFKELAPYEADWYYIRCASLVRHIYIRSPLGVRTVAKIYGGRKRNGVTPAHFCRSSAGIARKALQSLEALKLIEKTPEGGRRLTKQGRRDLDRIAAQVKAKARLRKDTIVGPIVL